MKLAAVRRRWNAVKQQNLLDDKLPDDPLKLKLISEIMKLKHEMQINL